MDMCSESLFVLDLLEVLVSCENITLCVCSQVVKPFVLNPDAAEFVPVSRICCT